ncbi:MAG: LemA family protein [Atopobiaceae bacterium]|nr:LemA family protein [Atopobiaceae bacterium]
MNPIVIAVIVIVVVLIIWGISIHNNIIRAYNKCDNAWAAIDTQLQRRNDLIPNLVNTVKGYAAHESQTLEAVTAARSAVANARTPEAKMEAAGTLSNALTSLFAVAENYPELKANQNFLELQSELADTENRLSYARMSYNDVVMNYNNIISVFPNNLLAGGHSPRPSFQITDESARQAPNVQF